MSNGAVGCLVAGWQSGLGRHLMADSYLMADSGSRVFVAISSAVHLVDEVRQSGVSYQPVTGR